jgi:hypothetical protein
VTATPKGALGRIPDLNANGRRVVIAVTEAARAGAAAAVVVQGGAERVTTPNPAGLGGATVCEAALVGGLAGWLAQAALATAVPSTTVVSSAARAHPITG